MVAPMGRRSCRSCSAEQLISTMGHKIRNGLSLVDVCCSTVYHACVSLVDVFCSTVYHACVSLVDVCCSTVTMRVWHTAREKACCTAIRENCRGCHNVAYNLQQLATTSQHRQTSVATVMWLSQAVGRTVMIEPSSPEDICVLASSECCGTRHTRK